jgi:hypothetical protein
MTVIMTVLLPHREVHCNAAAMGLIRMMGVTRDDGDAGGEG